MVWKFSELKRDNGRPAAPVYCGRVARGRPGEEPHVEVIRSVNLETGDVDAYTSGTQTCASVWACPVCSASIRDGRTQQLTGLLGEHFAAGGACEMVTLTVRHGYGDDLAALIEACAEAWRTLWTTRKGQAMRKRIGWVGAVRALEVTYGRNGWHPHLHALIFTESGVSDDQRADLQAWLSGAWADRVAALGAGRPSSARGVRVEPVRSLEAAGRYLSKVQDGDGTEADRDVASELMRGDLKQSRKRGADGSASLLPFQLLDILDTAPEHSREWKKAFSLWSEYEWATKGRRAITGLTPLLKRYGLEDQAEEDLAEREPDDDPAVVEEVALVVAPRLWLDVCRVGLDARVLEAVERGGHRSGREVLQEAAALARSMPPPDLESRLL